MNRDLMLYFLWNSGIFTNRQIGELLGLSYSSVSRRAAMVRKSIQKDKILLNKVQQLNTLIKLCPHFSCAGKYQGFQGKIKWQC